ncbi:MAG: hypothetical protein EXR58_06065 [Chloroflexi bacterium]|nr:hypothetical protein [Chloroflexota bacterium]
MTAPRRKMLNRPNRAATKDPERAQQWLSALEGGTSTDSLVAEILRLGADALSGIRALGTAGGTSVALLGALAHSPDQVTAVAAIDALGDAATTEAAEVISDLDQPGTSKEVRTAARRSLHKLALKGVHVARTEPSPARPGARVAELYRVIGSSFDGRGTRSLWMAGDRPIGGIYMIGLGLNDVDGLVDCAGRDTTRKRFAEQEKEMREKDPMAWVELPIEYGRQLVQEGLDLARGGGRAIPTQYALWAEVIGAPEEPFSEALIYQEINAFEMKMHPSLQGEGARLFEQPELEGWFFEPERVEKWARQLAEPAVARLVVTPETEQGRAERLLRDALAELMDAKTLSGLKRRLEETAYLFLKTDREADARRAVAAAVTIEEQRALRPPHPFLRALLERSIDIAQRVQRTGFEPVRLGRVE